MDDDDDDDGGGGGEDKVMKKMMTMKKKSISAWIYLLHRFSFLDNLCFSCWWHGITFYI